MTSRAIKVLVFLGLSSATGVLAAATNFAGDYDCKGLDPTFKHQTYDSSFSMTQKTENSYTTTQTDDQHNTYKGVAIYNDNRLSASFYLVSNSEIMGVEQYTIMSNGNLKGIFTYSNEPTKVGNEVCTKLNQ